MTVYRNLEKPVTCPMCGLKTGAVFRFENQDLYVHLSSVGKRNGVWVICKVPKPGAQG